MAKVEGALYVLKSLLAGDVVKNCEMAIKLGCSERQIRGYINNLRAIGIEIQSKTGSSGGYYLDVDKCPLCKNSIKRYY